MRDYLLISLVGGLAVFNSLFLAALFFRNHRGQLKNRLLGFLFLSLSVRVGKSLLIAWLHQVPDSVPAIGLLGMVATGPILYLYIRQFERVPVNLRPMVYWHFAPMIVIAGLLLLNSDRIVLWLYILSTAQLFIYLVFSWRSLPPVEDADTRNWIRALTLAIGIIGMVYASQIIIETRIAYFIATLIAATVLYGILYLAFQWPRPFMPARAAREPDDKLRALAIQLTKLMETEQIFRESDLSLSKVASRLGVKSYLVSQTVSTCLKKTFPEWVNEYRIREAERLLKSPQYSHYSIEGIAFESGFSTPSAFYTGFKKIRGTTPTAYKATIT